MRSQEVQAALGGAWRMMTGRPDGLRVLDLSADGFWNSFVAIPLAAPALLPGWVSHANFVVPEPAVGSRLAVIGRLAGIDLATWLVPILLFGIVATRVGLADRFTALIVATNWGTAVMVWLLLPLSLLADYLSGSGAAFLIEMVLIVISQVLTWRLTNAALERGPAIATAVYAASFAISLAIALALQSALGVQVPAG